MSVFGADVVFSILIPFVLELFDRIPRSQLNVIPEVYAYDREENGVIWSNNAISQQSLSDL